MTQLTAFVTECDTLRNKVWIRTIHLADAYTVLKRINIETPCNEQEQTISANGVAPH